MRFLSVALALVSIAALAVFLSVAGLRVAYPFELEWMEGGMLHHVQRVLDGEPLYVAPSLEFMAYPYTPLYVYAAALVSSALGADFLSLRLVSLVAALACFGLIQHIVRRDTDSPWSGLVAAGLFAACYDFSGSWFDVGRVDTLCLALVLAGVALAQRGRVPRAAAGAQPGRGYALGAGLLLFLAFLTKQSAAGPALGLFLALLVRDRREALRFVLAFGLPVAATSLWLDHVSEGWYRWHVFDLLASHELYRPRVLGFWRELIAHLGPAFAIAVWVRVSRPAKGGAAWDPLLVVVALSLVLSSWVARMHVGGFDNTLMPAALGAALLFGAALARASRRPDRRRALVLAAALAQFGLLVYDPRPKLPTPADRAAGERIVSELAAAPGQVWVPYHGYLAARAGRRAGAHAMPIIDLLQSGDRETAQAFVAELEAALAAQRWRLIVLDDLAWEEDLPALLRSYARTRVLLDPDRPELFMPRSGEPQRPVHVYEPRR